MDVVDNFLSLLSSDVFVLIGITMVLETTIEGGSTGAWFVFTVVFLILNQAAKYVHEGTDDHVEELHDELIESNQ